MLKKMCFLWTVFAGLLISVFASDIVWDQTNQFDGWKPLRNVKSEVKNGLLMLTEIENDPQLVSGPLKLDPARFRSFRFRYRYENPAGSSQGGQLYYARENGHFSDRARWDIPKLIPDGEWHTLVLTEKNMSNKVSWFEGGPITRLRLDPTGNAGGQIEISELRIVDSESPVKEGMEKMDVRRPLPPVEYTLDADKWPDLKPEYVDFSKPHSPHESYFRGKMIKSPQDMPRGGKYETFYLRREIELKEKPVQAWVQYVADDSAELFLNGTSISRNSNWKVTESAEVSPNLKKGKNVWGFRYNNARSAGGVFAELYVQYADGSFERFDTDRSFRSSAVKNENWSRPGFDASGWEGVIEQAGPPNFPWIVKVAYNDYAVPQRFLRGSVTPAPARAGSTVRLRFDFEGKILSAPLDAVLTLKKGESLAWSEKITLDSASIRSGENGTWSIEFDYRLPLYLNSGRLTARIESGSIFCKNGGFPEAEFDFLRIEQDPAFGRKPEVHIGQSKEYGPHVVLNGKPAFFIWGLTNSVRRPDLLPRFGDAPLNLVTVFGGARQAWPECGKFDPTVYDRNAEAWRRENPDAWFIWDLSIYPPSDWAEKYPDEMCQDEKGTINMDGQNSSVNHSFASRQALKDMEECLVKSIEYLESSPYANRILGYRVTGGHTIEWLGWDSSKPKRALDFSPAAGKAFEEFARKHYPQLQDYTIPTFAERHQLDGGELLWEPGKHWRSIAYHDFYSNAVADMVIHLCSKAKNLLNGRKLVGTYYGYVATLHGSGNSQMRAHYALKKVLDSKAVDFLLSPQAYSIRNLGDTCGDMKPFESIRKVGIIPVIEDDARTHCGAVTGGIYQTVTEQTTLDIVRRDLGIALCRNEIPYLYAIWNGTDFDFPALSETFEKIRRTGEFCLERNVRRNAKIAVVFSEKTVTSMPMLAGPFERTQMYQQYRPDGTVLSGLNNCQTLTYESFIGNATRFARLGAPVDYLLAEDLKDHPGEYKMYIFLNCFVYDQDFLLAVEKLRQRECTLFWVYAPGYTFDGRNSTENMKRLTGISLAKSDEPLVPAVKLRNGQWMGGRTTRFAPCFYVTDPNAEVLGVNELGQPGLAAVRTGRAESIFSCVYQLDTPFLTELAKRTGVHIYSENSDPMEANAALISLHARFAGLKTVKLPRKTNVLDVFNGRIIARDTEFFTFEASLHSSWLFYYGDDADDLLKKLQGR